MKENVIDLIKQLRATIDALETEIMEDKEPFMVIKHPAIIPVVNQSHLIILDAGHGDIGPDGLYTTAPSKMFKHEFFTFYEGVYNRLILKRLAGLLDASGYKYHIISHKWKDNSLRGRVKKVKELCKTQKCLLFSIHGNAAKNTSAHGIEVFTSIGQTQSDIIADQQIMNLQTLFPEENFRLDTTDGDLDKERDFYVLKRTPCPAILSEFGFFTNLEQAKKMLTKEWQLKCALATFNTISWCNHNL